MSMLCLEFLFVVFACLMASRAYAGKPFSLHPDNPHYFLFRGRPTLLITSAEHYGAVLNADFDYRSYLATLAADGMNHTRTFTGVYCEPAGAFKITGNTLSPGPGRLLCPWRRSGEPGYANGGNRFDLDRWDDVYFRRLRDFVSTASTHGIVVELNLFCPFYKDEMWALSPMQASNNVNGIGAVSKDDVYTLDAHGGLLEVQERMVRKVVEKLAEFDNVYFEVMNEPYVKGVSMVWQNRIVDVLVGADAGNRHLISMNVANGRAAVENDRPEVSVYNFHYAWPPDTVAMNSGLNRPIGDNETGFRGTGDAYYRREAWAFILAGGALFNNLDYSFTAGHEDGSFAYPADQPGGGSVALRRQVKRLSDFVHGFEFVRMRPDAGLVGGLPEGVAAFALAEEGSQYAVYVCRSGDLTGVGQKVCLQLTLPRGSYRAEWVDVLSGELEAVEIEHSGGVAVLPSPVFGDDIGLRVLRARAGLPP